MKRLSVLGLVFLTLTGCATGYSSMNALNGGYADTQLTKDTFLVSFRGNDMTAPERTRDFAMLRSAELVLQHGYPYFMVLDMDTKSNSTSYVMPTGNISTVSIGGYTSTNYTVPTAFSSTMFKSELKVKGFTAQTAPKDALQATQVITNIKGKYKLK